MLKPLTTEEFAEWFAALDDPAGLSGDDAARGPTVLWAAITAVLALAVWLLARRWHGWRRWRVYVAGAVPVGLALFVFFENVSRLLPANF